MNKFRNKVFLIIILFLTLSNFFVWREVLNLDGNLKVVFFDIGQGDSIFIRTPENHQIIIDGGPSGKRILEKLSGQIPFWDKTIDLAILTHPDYDHLGGLNYVLKSYRVENILWNGVKKGTRTFDYWEKNLEEEKAQIFIGEKSQRIKAGNLEFFVLYPFESQEGKVADKAANNTSIVMKMTFGENDFLLTGDIGEEIKKLLLSSGLEAEVLKVAHHGSKSSSNSEFLRSVNPELAVISVGRNNPYNHPHPEILKRLEDFAITVLRTDKSGDIEIKSDGQNLNFNYGISNFQNKIK